MERRKRPVRLYPALALAALMLVLTTIPAALAGTPEHPEIVDPAGDADVEWADLTAAWFSHETTDAVQLNLQVAEVKEAPVYGEVATHFSVGDVHFIAGWTTVVIPEPPVHYQGGFVCPTGEDRGDVDPAQCIGLPGEAGDDVYRVTVPRAQIGAVAADSVIGSPMAYAEVWLGAEARLTLDETETGDAYTFSTGEARSPESSPDDGPPGDDESDGDPETSPEPAASRPADPPDQTAGNEVPAPGLPAALGALVLTAFGWTQRSRGGGRR